MSLSPLLPNSAVLWVVFRFPPGLVLLLHFLHILCPAALPTPLYSFLINDLCSNGVHLFTLCYTYNVHLFTLCSNDINLFTFCSNGVHLFTFCSPNASSLWMFLSKLNPLSVAQAWDSSAPDYLVEQAQYHLCIQLVWLDYKTVL